jgi:hypothetical protein
MFADQRDLSEMEAPCSVAPRWTIELNPTDAALSHKVSDMIATDSGRAYYETQ